MNILYCGDKNILDGLIISILSLVHHQKEVLNIYILTMDYPDANYESLDEKTIQNLAKIIQEYNPKHTITLLNITNTFWQYMPKANLNTRFTPYCMLRLYADLLDLPSKILYLDNDVVALKDIKELYNIDNTNYELVGVLDNYGSKFFRKKIYRKDYLNSGVLLLNLDLIKKTKLLEKARHKCAKQKLLLPDQTALNIYSKHKLIVNRKFNEQKEVKDDTVIRHFSTTFKFWPKICTQTVKPWQITKLHDVLNFYDIDDLLEEYQEVLRRIKNE